MTRALEVAVYEPDGSTLVGTLASDNRREFLDDEDAEGAFNLAIKIGHADEAVATEDRICRFKVNGTARWQGFIEETAPTLADPQNRKAGQVIRVTGRGLLGLLDDASVYPELGLGRISPDTRYFNFASGYYDDTAWGNAVELKVQNDPDNTLPWFGAPKDWKDPNATWVGPTGGMTPPVAPGDIYLRGTFTIPEGEGGEYRIHITADDGFELYLDANRVLTEQRVALWGVTRWYDAILDEGTHLVAIKGTNFDRPIAATNVFGVIASISRVLGGGVALGDVVSGTSSGTKMLAYPTKAPGLTPGKILDVLLTEAQARGELPDLAWDFDADVDSDGVPWPNEIDISVPVNFSVGDVVRLLVEEKACNVRMAATGLTLQAYVKKGADLSETVAAEYAVNIGKHSARKQRAKKNVTLSRTAEGRWYESVESASVSVYGRRVAGLSLGAAPSDDAAIRQTRAFFADNAYPVHAITDLQLEAVNAVPYVDFEVGDIIAAPVSSSESGTFRVASIRVSEDAAGQPIYTPELVFAGTLWDTPFILWDDPAATWAGF